MQQVEISNPREIVPVLGLVRSVSSYVFYKEGEERHALKCQLIKTNGDSFHCTFVRYPENAHQLNIKAGDVILIEAELSIAGVTTYEMEGDIFLDEHTREYYPNVWAMSNIAVFNTEFNLLNR